MEARFVVVHADPYSGMVPVDLLCGLATGNVQYQPMPKSDWYRERAAARLLNKLTVRNIRQRSDSALAQSILMVSHVRMLCYKKLFAELYDRLRLKCIRQQKF